MALPPACKVAEAGVVMHGQGTTSPGEIGEPVDPALVHLYTAPKLARIAVWERDGFIVLVDVEGPAGTTADYLRRLGQPEARLDLDEDDHGSEWVWPARGVVLVVSGPTPSRLGVFPPQSLPAYRRHTRYLERTTYFE